MVLSIAIQHRLRLFREGLAQVLAAQDDVEVVGTAATAGELVAVCEDRRPAVVLMESDAPEWDGIGVAVRLRRSLPQLKLIGLSEEPTTSAQMARARTGGIATLVCRTGGTADVLAAIRGAPGAFRPVGSLPPRSYATDGAHKPPVLTPRELTILTLVGAGCTSRDISARLMISHKTVENHKQRIFRKLGVQNQAHAVSVAMRTGLMHPERIIAAAAD